MINFQTISSVNVPTNFKAKHVAEAQTENSADATIKTWLCNCSNSSNCKI